MKCDCAQWNMLSDSSKAPGLCEEKGTVADIKNNQAVYCVCNN